MLCRSAWYTGEILLRAKVLSKPNLFTVITDQCIAPGVKNNLNILKMEVKSYKTSIRSETFHKRGGELEHILNSISLYLQVVDTKKKKPKQKYKKRRHHLRCQKERKVGTPNRPCWLRSPQQGLPQMGMDGFNPKGSG